MSMKFSFDGFTKGFKSLQGKTTGAIGSGGKSMMAGLNKLNNMNGGTSISSQMPVKTSLTLLGFTAIAKTPGWVQNRANSALTSLYPENLLPTAQGKFGKRTDGLSQSPVQGVKFNFRRK